MYKVGLTGGIGSGKTTVSHIFSELGVPIVDADEVAHALVEPGQPALLKIAKTFGKRALMPDGSYNREYMRESVFSSAIKKKQLEDILHPLVYAAMQDKINKFAARYCVVCVPLLFETAMGAFVDRILVVDCQLVQQVLRVKKRNNLTEARISSIINSQVSRDYRLQHADDVIDNSGMGDELAEQVKKLHNLYLSISASLGYHRL